MSLQGLVEKVNSAARLLPTWAVYTVGVVPAAVLFYLGATGGLGVEPIKELEHEYGQLALQFLLASLCVTPLRRYADVNLYRFRRALGLLAFFYVTLHLCVWLILDVQMPTQIWEDILKRPYITIGMSAFLLLVPLALTSNNASLRRLGRKWQALHRLVYPAAILGVVHFVLLSKGFQIEPFIYLVVGLLLLFIRIKWRDQVRLLYRVCKRLSLGS